jgi:hypothetical protein
MLAFARLAVDLPLNANAMGHLERRHPARGRLGGATTGFPVRRSERNLLIAPAIIETAKN